MRAGRAGTGRAGTGREGTGRDIKHQNGHNSGPRGPPWPEFGQNDPTISPKVFSCPKEPNFN